MYLKAILILCFFRTVIRDCVSSLPYSLCTWQWLPSHNVNLSCTNGGLIYITDHMFKDGYFAVTEKLDCGQINRSPCSFAVPWTFLSQLSSYCNQKPFCLINNYIQEIQKKMQNKTCRRRGYTGNVTYIVNYWCIPESQIKETCYNVFNRSLSAIYIKSSYSDQRCQCVFHGSITRLLLLESMRADFSIETNFSGIIKGRYTDWFHDIAIVIKSDAEFIKVQTYSPSGRFLALINGTFDYNCGEKDGNSSIYASSTEIPISAQETTMNKETDDDIYQTLIYFLATVMCVGVFVVILSIFHKRKEQQILQSILNRLNISGHSNLPNVRQITTNLNGDIIKLQSFADTLCDHMSEKSNAASVSKPMYNEALYSLVQKR